MAKRITNEEAAWNLKELALRGNAEAREYAARAIVELQYAAGAGSSTRGWAKRSSAARNMARARKLLEEAGQPQEAAA